MMISRIDIDKSARNALSAGHPWIFSGKVLSDLKTYENGSPVYVYCSGRFMGTGFVSPANSIAVRMISRKRIVIDREFFSRKISALAEMRGRIINSGTDMYRLCFGEADGLPGLIADIYGRYAVFQTNSSAMMRNRGFIIEALSSGLGTEAVIDRTDKQSYIDEHEDYNAVNPVAAGRVTDNPAIAMENGIKYYVDLLNGHKTGFYIDQRDNRDLIRSISTDASVLNICSYSGGFTMSAFAGGASKAVSVDISAKALALCERNLELNGFDIRHHESIKADMFAFAVNEDLEKYDVIIIDPPAFAKHLTEKEQAIRAYQKINQTVLKGAASGTFIMTSSCTGAVTLQDFSRIIQKASRDSRKGVRILKRNSLPADHPILPNFTETEYLKTFLLYIE